MNHWPKYINIGYGTSLGQGDSTLYKIPGITNGHALRGPIFI